VNTRASNTHRVRLGMMVVTIPVNVWMIKLADINV